METIGYSITKWDVIGNSNAEGFGPLRFYAKFASYIMERRDGATLWERCRLYSSKPDLTWGESTQADNGPPRRGKGVISGM